MEKLVKAVCHLFARASQVQHAAAGKKARKRAFAEETGRAALLLFFRIERFRFFKLFVGEERRAALGSIVLIRHAGALGLFPFLGNINAAAARNGGDHLLRHEPRAQNLRRFARAVEDGALDAAFASAPVQNERDMPFEVFKNMPCGDGRDVLGDIGAGRGDRNIDGAKERLRRGR